MYFLLNMGIFQPAMLVYQRVVNLGLEEEKIDSQNGGLMVIYRMVQGKKSP